jgi:hypothetical protein
VEPHAKSDRAVRLCRVFRDQKAALSSSNTCPNENYRVDRAVRAGSFKPEGSEQSPIMHAKHHRLVATSHDTALSAGAEGRSPAEPAAISEALREEYRLLATMLASVWSASLVRVSLFLGVVSAIGVALGLAAQVGGGFGGTFTVYALVVLPLALFLGLGTFVRTIELQREAWVYITGMNRIRHAMADAVPASRPYFVLAIYDDVPGVYRSQGTGIRLHPPRYRLVVALVQTQGIVAVMCAALAGVIGGLATTWSVPALGWAVGAITFVVVLAALLRYWTRSLGQIQSAIRPMFPTPPEAIDAPI